MKRGPKPKSPEEKQAARLAAKTPPNRHATGRVPDMPETLPDGAKAVWCALLPEIAERVALQKFHGELLGQLCTAIYRRSQAEQLIEEQGLLVKGAQGNRVKNPACMLSRSYGIECQRIGAMFGMTPADLSRVPASLEQKIDPIAAAREALRGEAKERVQ